MSKLRKTKAARALWSALIACAAMITAASGAAQTAEEIMEANIKAVGGRDALLAVKSVHRTGTLGGDAGGQEIDGKIEVVVVPWKKVYNYSDLGFMKQTEAWNGEAGWQEGMMGLIDLDGPELKTLSLQAALNPFAAGPGDSKIVKLEDGEIEGTPCHVLAVRMGGAEAFRFHIDQSTNLIRRTAMLVETEAGVLDIHIDNLEYAEFGGVMLPVKEGLDIGGMMYIETQYTETTLNAPVDHAVFEKPKPK